MVEVFTNIIFTIFMYRLGKELNKPGLELTFKFALVFLAMDVFIPMLFAYYTLFVAVMNKSNGQFPDDYFMKFN